MNLRTVAERAKLGFKQNLRTYGVSISSLSVAFLCLSIALLCIANLSKLTTAWSQQRLVTVFLQPNASDADLKNFMFGLKNHSAITQIERVSPAKAKKFLVASSQPGSSLRTVPTDVFPDTVEIRVSTSTTQAQLNSLLSQIRGFSLTDEVETYQSWTAPIERLATLGKSAAAILAFLVLLCVLAVVANTIRLALATRRDEIYISRMCGATDSFIRTPLILEGAFQGLCAAAIAVAILSLAYIGLSPTLNSVFQSFLGMPLAFLEGTTIIYIFGTAILAGAFGSMLAIHKHMEV